MSKKFERILAFHCAPSLCGLKASNLINCSLEDFPMLEQDILDLNSTFHPKISFKILNCKKKRALILVYQKEKLEEVLFEKSNFDYLIKKNYPSEKNIELIFHHLQKNVEESASFPHEIGVFLGYDLDDIIQFERGNKECMYTGYWQVYSKVEEKKKLFHRFTTCRNNLIALIDKGYHLENIIR